MVLNFPYHRVAAAALRDQAKVVDIDLAQLLHWSSSSLHESPGEGQSWNVALARAREAARVEPKAIPGLKVIEDAARRSGWLGL
jgi:hypothetical protein